MGLRIWYAVTRGGMGNVDTQDHAQTAAYYRVLLFEPDFQAQ